MSDLFSLLKDISEQLPGCQMVSIVDRATGMQLASVGSDDSASSAGADAFQSELYRRAAALVEQLDEGPVETVVLESDGTTFVSEPIGESGYFWHVATRDDTTLGFTRAIMNKNRARVLEGVEGLIGDD